MPNRCVLRDIGLSVHAFCDNNNPFKILFYTAHKAIDVATLMGAIKFLMVRLMRQGGS